MIKSKGKGLDDEWPLRCPERADRLGDRGELRLHTFDVISGNGTAADGVLGSADSSGSLVILSGWDWYDGADQAGIGAHQFDFQTVVTHELGHALGLGHSASTESVMYQRCPFGKRA